ncbi:hypothetical protein [Rhizobacter sp. Root1221]|uniref:hypothetical protein n=1 Tax=Rhizobacter sp. Root1221 TaxID=1736433 RepID=UPI0006F4CA43|nr:hypothetical protein [Rhizobacter sp. Root1221]KQW00590.1 hypothetical protein ASC87_17135 [Rhizobacter sp. Root1221]
MDLSHRAKYMILFGPADAPRALLFNGDHRFLAEVFDEDGMVLQQLMKSGAACPPPRNLVFDGVAPPPPPSSASAMRCYALG